jgi:predicted acylesterase/phospholipase RssA
VAGRTLVVLGAGGAMGAFQAGALLVLFDAGLEPDAFFGCSAGALNAAFLASAPTQRRAAELAEWWCDPDRRVLSPNWRAHVRGVPALVRRRGSSLLDERPLRALISGSVRAHDISELARPLTVTTTCLDCGQARHHRQGNVVDVLVASCALPGLFAPVRLADDHVHVDGGVIAGVPLQAALAEAGPDDRILVIDCGLDPVTGVPGRCAALPGVNAACGLAASTAEPREYVAPIERSHGALDVMLRAFAVARAVANRASVGSALSDPRVQVLPHIADAWAAGLLAQLPAGPRDFRDPAGLVRAGRVAAERWLTSVGAGPGVPIQRS